MMILQMKMGNLNKAYYQWHVTTLHDLSIYRQAWYIRFPYKYSIS